MIDYTPTLFLRCHSRIRSDATDKRTSVWHCAFETIHGTDVSTLFASCGGNTVCVIDAKDASVKTKHYSKDYNENFHAVAWTTFPALNERISILAVAGSKSILHLLHPDKAICFAEHDLQKSEKLSSRKKPRDPIECIIFHPGHPNVLFGAFVSGAVHVWDIGFPRPPEYKCNLETLKTMQSKHCAYALTFSAHCDVLLSATEAGAVGWLVPSTALRSKETLKRRTFHFVSTRKLLPPEDKDFVDSIEAVGDGKMIASKCALHGCIYIWNLEEALKNQARVVQPLHTLHWSTTDNFYMNIGISASANILACGDDVGNLWVYNMKEIVSLPPQEHSCDRIIEWPVVRDSFTDRQKKLPFGNSDIVINKVALSYDAKFLVAVTNTNIVCIWQRDE